MYYSVFKQTSLNQSSVGQFILQTTSYSPSQDSSLSRIVQIGNNLCNYSKNKMNQKSLIVGESSPFQRKQIGIE